MLKCEECGYLFEEAKVTKDVHSECDECPHEEYEECPLCGSSYIEEIKPCKLCGNYSSMMIGDYCKDCIGNVTRRFEIIMQTDFDEPEVELLNMVYEGKEF